MVLVNSSIDARTSPFSFTSMRILLKTKGGCGVNNPTFYFPNKAAWKRCISAEPPARRNSSTNFAMKRIGICQHLVGRIAAKILVLLQFCTKKASRFRHQAAKAFLNLPTRMLALRVAIARQGSPSRRLGALHRCPFQFLLLVNKLLIYRFWRVGSDG